MLFNSEQLEECDKLTDNFNGFFLDGESHAILKAVIKFIVLFFIIFLV